LIVQRPLQSVDGIRFCIDWKELTLELLFEASPGSNWEDASFRLLAKKVLRPLCSTSILEEGESPEDFFLVADELLWGQAQIQHAGVEEGSSGTPFAREVWGRGEFWPYSLFRQSSQSKGRRSNQRGRCGYQRQSDSWCRSGAGHKLGDLLYLSSQGHESGVYSMF